MEEIAANATASLEAAQQALELAQNARLDLNLKYYHILASGNRTTFYIKYLLFFI